jgi:hypothetical protein
MEIKAADRNIDNDQLHWQIDGTQQGSRTQTGQYASQLASANQPTVSRDVNVDHFHRQIDTREGGRIPTDQRYAMHFGY